MGTANGVSPVPKKMGRPSKYTPEIIDAMFEYFDVGPTEKIEGKRYAVDLPTFEGFGASFLYKKLGMRVHMDTFNEWCDVHEEFSDAYKLCKQMQKNILCVNVVSGLYAGTGSIFVAKNVTDMRDQIDVSQRDETKLTTDELDRKIGLLMGKAESRSKKASIKATD